MRTSFIKNGLVIAVILLFIGVAVQPSIATVPQESIDVEYFDVTTEFIGLEKKYTTQLTKEEIKELDALFDSIYNRINNSQSLIETIEIFKEAVLKLDNLGLLGDVGIKETEKLVTNCYQNPKFMKTLEKGYDGEMSPFGDDRNLFCLIAGNTTGTTLFSLLAWGVFFLIIGLSLLTFLLLNIIRNDYAYSWGWFFLLLLVSNLFYVNPFCLARHIDYYDSTGKIITFGLNGFISWSGDIVGKILPIGVSGIGVVGFTGLQIQLGILSPWNGHAYYIGFAPYAHIEDS